MHFLKGFCYRWIPALLWAGIIFYLSSRQLHVRLLVYIPYLDKMAHTTIFGILALYLLRGIFWKDYFFENRFLFFRTLVIVVVIVSIYGATDEWHQSFVPGRSVSFWDWTADTMGSILAVIFYTYMVFPRKNSILK